MKKITRVEVIDETGRAYVKYLEDNQEVVCDLQDNGRTLKVFIELAPAYRAALVERKKS